MKTDKELLKAFREQFNTGGMLSESNVLVLMGMARGEERKLNKGFECPVKCPHECPVTKTTCIHLGKTVDCYDCNVPDLTEK